jgi:hypothetical protein
MVSGIKTRWDKYSSGFSFSLVGQRGNWQRIPRAINKKQFLETSVFCGRNIKTITPSRLKALNTGPNSATLEYTVMFVPLDRNAKGLSTSYRLNKSVL